MAATLDPKTRIEALREQALEPGPVLIDRARLYTEGFRQAEGKPGD